MIVHLLIIQVVTFIVLLIVLRQLFYKQLGMALARLKVLNEKNLAREEELKKEAERLEQQREEELRKIHVQAEEIIKEARSKSVRMTMEATIAANEHLDKVLAQGQNELAKKQRDLTASEHARASDLAVRMVQIIMSVNGKQAMHECFIKEAIDEVMALDPVVFTGKSVAAKVVTAIAMDQDKIDLFKAVLSKKKGVAVSVAASVDAGIIAGVIINMSELTIDGTLKNKLNKAVNFLSK